MVSDKLTLRLHVNRQPYATNGKWDEAAQTVSWTNRIAYQEFPTLCFCLWSESAAKYQSDHFGGIILDQEALAGYALWYRGLTAKEAADWDKFVAELKPTAELTEQLDAFRFGADPPAEGEKARGLPKILLEMIQKSIKDAKLAPAPNTRE